MATLVINVSRVPQHVGLILANGKKAYSRIMQRSRATIATGAKIDPHWLAMNPGVIRIVEAQKPAVKQAKTNSSKPAANVVTAKAAKQTATTASTATVENTAPTVTSATGVTQ
jgi:hypothetical protein